LVSFLYDQVIIPALSANRAVLAMGDAHLLNDTAYVYPGSAHAFLLTNYCTDESGFYLYGYIGIDSNFPGQELLWPAQKVESAVQWAAKNLAPALC
jgi:hypothetical protein